MNILLSIVAVLSLVVIGVTAPAIFKGEGNKTTDVVFAIGCMLFAVSALLITAGVANNDSADIQYEDYEE